MKSLFNWDYTKLVEDVNFGNLILKKMVMLTKNHLKWYTIVLFFFEMLTVKKMIFFCFKW